MTWQATLHLSTTFAYIQVKILFWACVDVYVQLKDCNVYMSTELHNSNPKKGESFGFLVARDKEIILGAWEISDDRIYMNTETVSQFSKPRMG